MRLISAFPRARLSACALAVCCLALPAHAEESGEPVFSIKGFRHSGNTLLPESEVSTVLTGFAGEQGSFTRIQLAIAALESHYAERGFGAVKVVLPEQDIEDGIVALNVVEGRVAQVIVEGAQYFSTENILASLPELQPGSQPNMNRLDASLRLANQSSAKQTSVVFRQSEQAAAVDAVVRVADDKPWRVALLTDNTGSSGSDGRYATGRYRTGVVLQHANLLDRDHAASIQYVTSPGHEKDVTIAGLSYRVPLYTVGDALELSLGYSNVNSGKIATTSGPIGIAGGGKVASLKYNHTLPRLDKWRQNLIAGLDYRDFSNKVKADGSDDSLIPDARVKPFSLAYQGVLSEEGREVALSVSYVHNIPGGRNGRTEDFTLPGGRQGATASYQYWRYSIDLTQALPEQWLLKAGLSGQYTRDALIAGELYGVGGADSVRGFQERSVANDKGHRIGLEVHTPDLSRTLGWGGADWRWNLLAFYDYARVGRNKALANEVSGETIASTGLGARATYARNFSLRLDWGLITQAGADRQRWGERVHANLMFTF